MSENNPNSTNQNNDRNNDQRVPLGEQNRTANQNDLNRRQHSLVQLTHNDNVQQQQPAATREHTAQNQTNRPDHQQQITDAMIYRTNASQATHQFNNQHLHMHFPASLIRRSNRFDRLRQMVLNDRVEFQRQMQIARESEELEQTTQNPSDDESVATPSTSSRMEQHRNREVRKAMKRLAYPADLEVSNEASNSMQNSTAHQKSGPNKRRRAPLAELNKKAAHPTPLQGNRKLNNSNRIENSVKENARGNQRRRNLPTSSGQSSGTPATNPKLDPDPNVPAKRKLAPLTAHNIEQKRIIGQLDNVASYRAYQLQFYLKHQNKYILDGDYAHQPEPPVGEIAQRGPPPQMIAAIGPPSQMLYEPWPPTQVIQEHESPVQTMRQIEQPMQMMPTNCSLGQTGHESGPTAQPMQANLPTMPEPGSQAQMTQRNLQTVQQMRGSRPTAQMMPGSRQNVQPMRGPECPAQRIDRPGHSDPNLQVVGPAFQLMNEDEYHIYRTLNEFGPQTDMRQQHGPPAQLMQAVSPTVRGPECPAQRINRHGHSDPNLQVVGPAFQMLDEDEVRINRIGPANQTLNEHGPPTLMRQQNGPPAQLMQAVLPTVQTRPRSVPVPAQHALDRNLTFKEHVANTVKERITKLLAAIVPTVCHLTNVIQYCHVVLNGWFVMRSVYQCNDTSKLYEQAYVECMTKYLSPEFGLFVEEEGSVAIRRSPIVMLLENMNRFYCPEICLCRADYRIRTFIATHQNGLIADPRTGWLAGRNNYNQL